MRKVDLQGVISNESGDSNNTGNDSCLHIKLAVKNVLFSAVWLENQDVEGKTQSAIPAMYLASTVSA